MLVVTTIRLSKGFKAWNEMVHSSEEKLKEYGMTFIFAGTEADDDSDCIRLSILSLKRIYNDFIKMKSLHGEEQRQEQ